jgi:hypothetical protein
MAFGVNWANGGWRGEARSGLLPGPPLNHAGTVEVDTRYLSYSLSFILRTALQFNQPDHLPRFVNRPCSEWLQSKSIFIIYVLLS